MVSRRPRLGPRPAGIHTGQELLQASPILLAHLRDHLDFSNQSITFTTLGALGQLGRTGLELSPSPGQPGTELNGCLRVYTATPASEADTSEDVTEAGKLTFAAAATAGGVFNGLCHELTTPLAC